MVTQPFSLPCSTVCLNAKGVSTMQNSTLHRFKNNGQNFQIQLQSSHHHGSGASGASSSATSALVPEDLVQIQAYLRWERNGKQSYTPEQEKESF